MLSAELSACYLYLYEALLGIKLIKPLTIYLEDRNAYKCYWSGDERHRHTFCEVWYTSWNRDAVKGVNDSQSWHLEVL